MNDRPSFFDPKTVGAMIVVFAVWMGWQFYMQKKYPHMLEKKQTAPVEAPIATESTESDVADVEAETETLKSDADAQLKPGRPPVRTVEERSLSFESPGLSFEVSSKGMGLKGVRLKNFTDRAGAVISLGTSVPEANTFETKLLGHTESLDFDLEKINDTTFLGRAQWGNVEITKKMEVISSKFEILTNIEVSGMDSSFIGLTTTMYEDALPVKSGGFFVPQFEIQEFYISGEDGHERIRFPKEDLEKSFVKLHLASLGSQYFVQAFINRSEILPDLKVSLNHKTKMSSAQVGYQVLNRNDKFHISYSTFVGPKDIEILRSVHSDLGDVVDFGWFSWIAKYILVFLKWFYALTGNWGVAIILLTMAVRLLVLPFNIMSYKSMKVMQVLQPQMKSIREKYKEDQQKMNLEIMALLKNNKANPLGGCLPMVLQFPIFLALYQVLGHSIELYQAPFALWIHDLSAKDPYYVLPVLMGLTLFMQQKITPNTMDPAQAKILMFMPLLFSFFMLSLPSGLTLYIFVSGLFGVAQQYYFMKFNHVQIPALAK